MSRTRTLIAASSAAAAMIGMTIVAGSGLAAAAPTPGVARLEGSAVPFTSRINATGSVAASQKLSVQVWLRPRLSRAGSFATAVSTPGSALFHRYLSPASYAADRRVRGHRGQVEAAARRGLQRRHGQPAALLCPGHRGGVGHQRAFRTQLKLYPASAG